MKNEEFRGSTYLVDEVYIRFQGGISFNVIGSFFK